MTKTRFLRVIAFLSVPGLVWDGRGLRVPILEDLPKCVTSSCCRT